MTWASHCDSGLVKDRVRQGVNKVEVTDDEGGPVVRHNSLMKPFSDLSPSKGRRNSREMDSKKL